ncbi:MAG: transcriptional regulator [Clostridia bacterium]|nr:transcriptional regulator [Clostridia bacterium]
MGKASLCIQMLQLLNTGKVWKVSELADRLETNPRNILEYKKELEECGYFITNIPGRYGGYKLEDSALIPSLKLSPNEKNALIESYDYIKNKNDFMDKDNYETAFSKVISSVSLDEKKLNLIAVDKYQLSMPEEEIKKRYDFIDEAIKKKRVIEVDYNSLRSGLKLHILHPYKLFLYNNSWFFLAWYPDAGDVWYFKVNRIEKYKMTDRRFTVHKYFKAEDYFDKFGLIKNGDYHHLKLIATGTRATLLKERVYGKNQTMKELGDGKYLVEFDMQNKSQIVSFAMSCKDEVQILEPDWLIEELVNIFKKQLELYEKKEEA